MTVKTKSLALSISLILGIAALILTLTLIPKSQETRRRAFEQPTTITDNFDGAALDLQFWAISSPNNIAQVTQANGRLITHIPASSPPGTWAALVTKNNISGDFTAEIDIPLFQVDSSNEQIATSELKFWGLSDDNVLIVRWVKNGPESQGGSYIDYLFSNGPSTFVDGPDNPRLPENVSPKLKLNRTGSTFTISVNTGSGFEIYHTVPNGYTGPGQIQLLTYKTINGQNNPDISAEIDNFSLIINPQITTQSIDPPANLTATCAYSGKEVTLTWDTVPQASTYLLRINDPRNDAPSCGDGWYCSDPPDKAIDENLTASSYIHTGITPNQNYRAWVHAHLADSSVNSEATTIEFACPSPITGDINLDKIVDITDYSFLVNQFLSTGTDLAADINQDGKVDTTDYSLLVTNFGQTRP